MSAPSGSFRSFSRTSATAAWACTRMFQPDGKDYLRKWAGYQAERWYLQRGTPILTYESDGYAVSPSFLRQVDVHIQRVLEHAAKTHT